MKKRASSSPRVAPREREYTVIALQLDHDESLVQHVYARTKQAAIRAVLQGTATSLRVLHVYDGHLQEAAR